MGGRKYHGLVGKNIVHQKDHGGLGVKDIAFFNSALLAKWRWNMFHQKGELWERVLNSKYLSSQGVSEGEVRAH